MFNIINSLLKDAWMFFALIAILNVLAVCYKLKNRAK